MHLTKHIKCLIQVSQSGGLFNPYESVKSRGTPFRGGGVLNCVYSVYKFMSSQYESLREQAEIYQKLTRKKCSIFHRNESEEGGTFKLPRATRHSRFMTQPMYCEPVSVGSQGKSYQVRTCLKRSSTIFTPKSNDEIFFNVLKSGIKIDLSDRKAASQSKPTIKPKTVSKKSSKKKQNPEESSSLLQKKSQGTIVAEQFSLPTPYNTVSHQSLLNSHSEHSKQQAKVNFLTLNKSNVMKPKRSKADPVGGELLGRSKKERMLLERKNREESALQEEIRVYHLRTKSLLEEMKLKYDLTFAKDRKYLPKRKKEKSVGSEGDAALDTLAYIREEEIKFDRVKEDMQDLDSKYRSNLLRLAEAEQAISSNDFQCYLKTSSMERESASSKLNIISKLKQSLLRLRQRQAPAPPLEVKVNDRLKELLFT